MARRSPAGPTLRSPCGFHNLRRSPARSTSGTRRSERVGTLPHRASIAGTGALLAIKAKGALALALDRRRTRGLTSDPQRLDRQQPIARFLAGPRGRARVTAPDGGAR
jgi:hypothetical protein